MIPVYIRRSGTYYFWNEIRWTRSRSQDPTIFVPYHRQTSYMPGDQIWDNATKSRFRVRNMRFEWIYSLIPSFMLRCEVAGSTGGYPEEFFAGPNFTRICSSHAPPPYDD